MEELILTKKAIKWINDYYDIGNNEIKINIYRKDGSESYNVFIDKSDFEIVSKCQWYINIDRKNQNLKNIPRILWTKQFKDGSKKCYEIYQIILDTKNKNVVVDHKDENRFNNRRSNLRIVDSKINRINQSPRQASSNKFIKGRQGYNFDKQTGKYISRISVCGKEVNIGRYKTELEAETIYLKCNILIGNDKISTYISNRIKELNITLTEEEINTNKYLLKIKNKLNMQIEL